MFDVFVIGGGLSGLNSAISLLKDADLRIGLADRKKSDQNNPARFTFSELIQKYDLSDCAFNSYNSFGIISYHGAEVVHNYSENQFFALNYNKACNRFLQKLMKNKNFTKFDDRVTDLKLMNEYIELSLVSGVKVRSKLVIDASGISHFSLRYLNTPEPRLYSHSFGQSFINCSNKNSGTAYFIAASVDYGSGGGWYYPIGTHQASFGMALITTKKQFPAKKIREKYYKSINEIEPIRSYIKNAEPVKYEIGTIPIQPVKKYVHGRILIVGDAGGQATSWMCMGVEPALSNSEMVAKAIKNAKMNNDFNLEKLNQYQHDWDLKNKAIFENIEKQPTKIWFLGEDIWDFIIKKDLKSLTPQEFYERIKYNKHLMSRIVGLFKWILFRIEILGKTNKYKKHFI